MNGQRMAAISLSLSSSEGRDKRSSSCRSIISRRLLSTRGREQSDKEVAVIFLTVRKPGVNLFSLRELEVLFGTRGDGGKRGGLHHHPSLMQRQTQREALASVSDNEAVTRASAGRLLLLP